MNVDTGELRRLLSHEEELKLIKNGFTPVPEELKEEANRALGNRDSVVIDMETDTPLANWANKARSKNKKKTKRKMATTSRRRNRS